MEFVSRAGQKLQFALESFSVSPNNLVCADFGSSTGGFVDCLLQNGATKVYAVDTSYGEFAWTLRNDPRVVVMERTNAMHVSLSEKVDLITVDTGWTKQKDILPNVYSNLKDNGVVITLVKPHYEAPKLVKKGLLPESEREAVLQHTKQEIEELGFEIAGLVESPLIGAKGGNTEYLVLLKKGNNR